MQMIENTIICGPAEQVLPTIPTGSINCSISSPPYWALRDYGVDGQLGLEKTFEEYIDKLCTIYDEVKRVLRDDGTCWVNLGDSYSSCSKGSGGTHYPDGTPYKQMTNPGSRYNLIECKASVQDKSLCLIPQRFAIEMVNRGWILRNVIIWAKPNPMPSSAKDRFTVDYEQVFFFVKSNETLSWVRPDGVMVTKQPDYKSGEQGLDWEWGIRKGKRVKLSLWKGYCYFFEPQYEPHNTPIHLQEKRVQAAVDAKTKRVMSGDGDALEKWSIKKPEGARINPLGRNKRTVWTIPTQAYPDAHFATFPEKLVEPMILSGCPKEVCTKCGQGRRKVYEPTEEYKKKLGSWQRGEELTKGFYAPDKQYSCTKELIFKGYTDCGCKDREWRPGIVLDPFVGRARLARSLPSKDATGSELNLSRSISKWRCAA